MTTTAPPPADAVTALVEQALGALGAGSIATARRLLRRAVAQAARAEGDEARVLRARPLVTLAAAEHDRLGLDGALALLDEAEALAASARGHPEAATIGVLARVQRAALLGRSGRWRESVALYDGLAGDPLLPPRAACVVELNRGLGRQLLGDLAGSEESLRRAEERSARHGQLDLLVAAVHNRGVLALTAGDVPATLELMGRASALGPDVQPVAARLDHARALMEVGMLDEASPLLSEAARVATSSGARLDLAETWMEQARLALLRDDPAGARATARRAARSFERLGASAWARRARLVALEAGLMAAERAGTPAQRRRLIAEAEGVAGADAVARALLATALVQAGRTRDAAAALGRTPRGVAPLGDTLRTGLVRARVHAGLGRLRGADAALAATATLLAERQAGQSDLETRTALAVHGRRLRDLDVTLALADGGVPALYRASERWRSVARRLPWVVPDAPPPAATDLRPASLPAMRAGLRARGAGLVSLMRHRGTLYAITLGDGRDRLSRLGPEEIWREAASRIAADALALTRVREPSLRGVVRASLDRSARQFGDLLAPAVPAASRCAQVVVIPSEILGPVPWRLVPGLAGRPLVVAPAATAWLERAEVPAARPDARTTAFAGPALDRAAAEAAGVASLRGGVLLTGPDAHRAALLRAFSSPGVVHVAAHGTHHEQSPMFSAISLADGPAYAHTIQQAGVRAELIVLSACEVGRAQPRPGDEALGLTAALLACGGRTVVAACGPVPDATAAAMMPALHEGLLAGLDAATALERCAGDDPVDRLFCAYGAA